MAVYYWSGERAPSDGRMALSLASVGAVVLLVAVASSMPTTAGTAQSDSGTTHASREAAFLRDVGELPPAVTQAQALGLATATCDILATGVSGDVVMPWLRDRGFGVLAASRLVATSVATLCPGVGRNDSV